MSSRCLFLFGLLIASFLATPGVSLADTKAKPTIPAHGKTTAAQRVAMVKVSYLQALKVAVTAVPGRIDSGDLEVENGYLIYDFVIVTTSGKAMEIEVDPGTGALLSVDEADED